MAKRRKVNNLLALALLAALVERPMHPYQIASVLRARGKEDSMKINWGSLYTVVENLEKHGFIRAVGTTREGRRPERTVFSITEAGREEVRDWLRDLVGIPEKEHTKFEAALSVLGILPPDEATDLLGHRLRVLDAEIAEEQTALRHWSKEVPRMFLIEAEYQLAIRKAEAKWLRSLHKELADGSMPGMADWRYYHETGQMPPELAELAERGLAPD